MTHFGFPFRIDARGRSADASEAEHLRQLVEQVLFTSPGERVNRPEFGAGLNELVFEPASPELVSALQGMVRAALQRYLGELLRVEQLEVRAEEETVFVTVGYVDLRTQESTTATFTRRR